MYSPNPGRCQRKVAPKQSSAGALSEAHAVVLPEKRNKTEMCTKNYKLKERQSD